MEAREKKSRIKEETHDVPDVVGEPVDDGIHAAHELQVLGFGRALRDQEHDETRGHERHGDNDEYGDHHIRALPPAKPHQVREKRGQ